MFTYMLNSNSKTPLYEQLYNHIKEDILSNKILADEKLPSKRQLASHLKVSVITVETAYEQLVSEGYIFSKPKSGYYVNDIQRDASTVNSTQDTMSVTQNLIRSDYKYEFKTNAVDTQNFPFSIWAKLIREVLRDKDKELLNKSEAKGVYALRVEIARYLKAYRNISCHPEQIVVGAGSEYLINLIIQLLDKAKRYAVENPGYHKIARIISSYGIDIEYLPLDEFGMSIDRLIYSKSDVLHISPSHQFPTGITTPVKRRYELLQWAANSDGYIIEDDYDSEFRYTGKPVPALQSLDANNRVIYMNTFTKSLAPSLRISYMVLPPDLMYKFDKEFTFYSNTVSCFEQYTLAKFMSDGYFERHLNRMRNIYKSRIAAIKEGLANKKITIKGENVGLHLVLEFDKGVDTLEIVKKAAEKSIHITDINSYYVSGKPQKPAIVLGYTGMDSESISSAISLLNEIW